MQRWKFRALAYHTSFTKPFTSEPLNGCVASGSSDFPEKNDVD